MYLCFDHPKSIPLPFGNKDCVLFGDETLSTQVEKPRGKSCDPNRSLGFFLPKLEHQRLEQSYSWNGKKNPFKQINSCSIDSCEPFLALHVYPCTPSWLLNRSLYCWCLGSDSVAKERQEERVWERERERLREWNKGRKKEGKRKKK